MWLLTSLSKSVVKGRDFTIASASTSSVCKDSSLRLAPLVFRRDPKIFLADLVCLSHTRPMLLAAGQVSFSGHSLIAIILHKLVIIFWWFLSVKALVSSAGAPTKFVSLSDLISLTFPFQPICFYKHTRKQSVVREFAASIWMALLDRQVNSVLYRFSSFCPSFTTNGANRSSPQ